MEELDVVLFDNSLAMQRLVRGMLGYMNIGRVRAFGDINLAIMAMRDSPADLFITDWEQKPVDSFKILRALRHKLNEPICYTSVIVLTAFTSVHYVRRAMAAGAHQFLAKPISQQTLSDRILWAVNDDRQFELVNDIWAIEGVGALDFDQNSRSQIIHAGKNARRKKPIASKIKPVVEKQKQPQPPADAESHDFDTWEI